MKKIKTSLIIIIGFLFTLIPGSANAASTCYTRPQNNNSVNIGDTFTYELGINEITSYTTIYGFHFEIEYDPEVLTPILEENTGIGSYNNWETIYSYIDTTSTYGRLNTLVVDMQTNNASRQISYQNSRYNIKLGYVKFTVNETNATSTTLTLKTSDQNNSLTSYKYIISNNSSNKYTTEACTNASQTMINIKKNNTQNQNQNINQNIYQNAYLTALTIDGLTINNFNSNNYSYTYDTTQRALNIRAYAPNGFTITGDVGYKTVNYGNNQYKIQVTSPNGDRKEYVINVSLPDYRSSVNTLSYLNTSIGNINFNSYTNYYTLNVPNDTQRIRINSGLTNANSTYVNGYGNREVYLNEGNNQILIKVRAENGSINTYTLNVVRENRNYNCDISDIYIDDYNFDFDYYKTNYKLTIRPKTSKLDIRVYLQDEESTYKIYGNKNLDTGSTIRIEVTDINQNVKNYYINITKEESTVERESFALPIAIFVILILIALIVIILLRRRRDEF